MCKQKLPAAGRRHVVCVPTPPGRESPENLQQGGRRHDRAINTTDVMSDTAASYAISDEQGASKNALDNRQ